MPLKSVRNGWNPLHPNHLSPCVAGFSLAAALLFVSPLAHGQTVTVSKTVGPADESTIQAAIDSLAPGGSRDDGDPTNNIVQILDDSVYSEALLIDGFGLTLESTGAQRPTIITTAAQAASNPNGFAVRVDTDNELVFRRLIFLPDAASPPFGFMTVDEFTDSAGNAYTVVMEDILIAGNDGSGQPISLDGLTPPPPGTVTYEADVLDFNSTPTPSTPAVTLERVVITGASGGTGDLVRFFTDGGTIEIREGCVFSYSVRRAVNFSNALSTVAEWRGSADDPIIIHGNGSSAIRSNSSATRSVSVLEHVAITRNSLAVDAPAIIDNYAGFQTNNWSNVTIAGTRAQEGSSPTDGPFSVQSAVTLVNCIIAGDGGEGIRGPRNLAFVGNNALLRADGVCFDVSHGGTTLNTAWQRDNGQAIDGVDGVVVSPIGAGWTGLSPDFRSLEPASPDYLAVSNPEFRTLGPGGVPLTGAGAFDPPPFVGIRTLSGNLQSHLEGIAVPSASSSNKYSPPSEDQQLIFRGVILNILGGRLQAASDLADLVNYDVIVYQDTPRDSYHALLQERSTNTAWRGVFVFDLSPNRMLFVESPHPLFDGTRVQGIDLYINIDAFAFMQSGTHRNNLQVESPCDGTQTSGDPYWVSDMAHVVDSFFQAAHEVVHNFHTDTVSVSVHGMAATSDPSDVVLSNGTGATTTNPSLSRNIASTMNSILSAASDSRYAVSHQEPGENPALSGSTNTQGRYTNGSHRPCTSSAQALFPERFIHMEQAPSVRNSPSSNWAFVIETYNNLISSFDFLAADPPEDGSILAEYPLDGNVVPTTSQEQGASSGNVAPAENRFAEPSTALSFNNKGYATIPDFPYDGSDKEFTISLWFKATASGADFQYLLSHGSIGRDGEVTIPNSMQVYLTGDTGQLRVRFTLADGTRWNFNGPTGVADDEWHFFALAYSQVDGTTIYVDGVEAGNEPDHRLRFFNPEGAIYLGARSDLSDGRFLAETAGLTGYLDQLRIHNAALTPQAIDELFNEEAPASHFSNWFLF